MRRFLCLLLGCVLMTGAVLPGLAETVPAAETAAETEEAAEAAEDPEEADEEGEGPDEAVPIEDEEDGDGQEPEDRNPEELPDEEDLEEEIVDSRVLQYGDEGEDVLELQTRLQELKYYTGNLSGRYREGTREAVRTFQGDYGLEKTGIADPATQSRIYSARYRSLRYGAEGEEVRNLQTRLMELGYYKGKISGNYLGGTQKSVR